MEHIDYRQIAKQLSHPEGKDGIVTGQIMQEGNKEMYLKTIDLLRCEANDHVLEIGHGNGSHVRYLLNQTSGVRYQGIDISETMVNQASEINKDNDAKFMLGNGIDLPFADHHFDWVFTVNTIYFWKNPQEQLAEIYRILKPGGYFLLAFRSENFMRDLPFTSFGFILYDEKKAINELQGAGFKIVSSIYEQEKESVSQMGGTLQKDRIIITAEK